MAKEWKEAFCDLCGRTMGMKNVYVDPKKPWTKTGEKNMWEETLGFDPSKPFGVVKSSAGRGTMQLVRYYDIDEDVEGYFPPMKQRLLNLLQEWIQKGRITREEIEEAIT